MVVRWWVSSRPDGRRGATNCLRGAIRLSRSPHRQMITPRPPSALAGPRPIPTWQGSGLPCWPGSSGGQEGPRGASGGGRQRSERKERTVGPPAARRLSPSKASSMATRGPTSRKCSETWLQKLDHRLAQLAWRCCLPFHRWRVGRKRQAT